MTAAISSELLKLRTTRSFYWLIGSVLALVLVVTIPLCAFADFGGDGPLEALLWIFGQFVQALALLLGALLVTSEFRHGTITPSLLVVPSRTRLMGAKLISAIVIGAALGFVSGGLIVAIVSGFGSARDFDTSGDKLQMIVGATLASGLYGALGVGVGALVRNQVGAIVGSMLYLFVGETIITVVLSLIDSLDDIMPRYSLGAVSNALSLVNPGDEDVLGQVAGGLLLALYAGIFVVAGFVMMQRRDVTA